MALAQMSEIGYNTGVLNLKNVATALLVTARGVSKSTKETMLCPIIPLPTHNCNLRSLKPRLASSVARRNLCLPLVKTNFAPTVLAVNVEHVARNQTAVAMCQSSANMCQSQYLSMGRPVPSVKFISPYLNLPCVKAVSWLGIMKRNAARARTP